MLLVERAYHLFPINPDGPAFAKRGGGSHAPGMGISNTFLSEEIPRPQQGNGRFLAARRDYRELGLAVLDVKDSVRQISLGKDNLFLFQVDNRPAHAGPR